MAQAETRALETRFGPPSPERPVVSVLMITYNHERFIREAIESVFAQVVDFPIELVISDDCSTDSTGSIVREVCAGAPISVRFVAGLCNVGMHRNFRRVIALALGEFSALLEGDDYWIEPGKLARQVGVLRADCRASLSFHKAVVKYEPGSNKRLELGREGNVVPPVIPDVIGIFEVAGYEFIVPTGSVVFRTSLLSHWPDWADELPWCDILLFLIAADKGSLIGLSDPMSVYRITSSGASSGLIYTSVYNGYMKMLWHYKSSACIENKSKIQILFYKFFDNYADHLKFQSQDGELKRLLGFQLIREIRDRNIRPKTFKWCLSVYFPRFFQFLAALR